MKGPVSKKFPVGLSSSAAGVLVGCLVLVQAFVSELEMLVLKVKKVLWTSTEQLIQKEMASS